MWLLVGDTNCSSQILHDVYLERTSGYTIKSRQIDDFLGPFIIRVSFIERIKLMAISFRVSILWLMNHLDKNLIHLLDLLWSYCIANKYYWILIANASSQQSAHSITQVDMRPTIAGTFDRRMTGFMTIHQRYSVQLSYWQPNACLW